MKWMLPILLCISQLTPGLLAAEACATLAQPESCCCAPDSANPVDGETAMPSLAHAGCGCAVNPVPDLPAESPMTAAPSVRNAPAPVEVLFLSNFDLFVPATCAETSRALHDPTGPPGRRVPLMIQFSSFRC